jgi:heavy metal sensor kinase
MRSSIRWRLTRWNTLAFALALAGFGGLFYLFLWQALHRQVDRTLTAGFELLRSDPALAANPDRRLDYWVEEFKEHQNIWCAVFQPDGTVYMKHPDLANAAVPFPALDGAGQWEGTVSLEALGRQRGNAERLRIGQREWVVLLLAPLGEVDRELRVTLMALLVAGTIMVLASGGLAYALARKALAPMEHLRRSTEAITADRLDRRLPVLNPHDELGRLSATINAMIARLEQSFAEIRRFTADASHELRTPVTLIRTEAEVAYRDLPGPEGCQVLIGNILEECQRMTHLTDQLLTLAREDTGMNRPLREPLDLTRLVLEIGDALRPLAESREQQLRAVGDQPVWVDGDPARLRQVFVNLIDNAIKYTPEGGRIDVAVRKEGADAVVTIEDTGVGIPAEHLPHIFDRFYRVDRARSRAEGGTGLGLSIARSIVIAHGGQIDLVSTPGKGTVCTVRLVAR